MIERLRNRERRPFRRARRAQPRSTGGGKPWPMLVAGVPALLLVAVTRVAAQCPMCGSATAYAGSSAKQAYATFSSAALVLLVPVVLLMGAVGGLLWKHRH